MTKQRCYQPYICLKLIHKLITSILKKLAIILFFLIFISCNKNEYYSEQEKYQNIEKLEKNICNCFNENKNKNKEIMKCFELQDKYWKNITDSLDRIKFLETTYKCIN